MIIQRKRVAKRLASGLLAGALALGGLAISGGVASANTPTSPSTNRIYGADRYETATKIARELTASPTGLVIASGEAPWDALAGAVLTSDTIPMLLVRSNSIPSSVSDWIADHKTSFKGASRKVYILGGESAISDDVKTALTSALTTAGDLLPPVVTRVSGTDRYATAEAISKIVGVTDASDSMIIVNGATGWADALSASVWSAEKDWPIVLTNGGLQASAKAAIDAYLAKPGSVAKFVIVGGPLAVSSTVTEYLISEGVAPGDIQRVMGADRYQTNLMVQTQMINNGFGTYPAYSGAFGKKIALASGEAPFDALVAAPWAAKNNIHVVLTPAAGGNVNTLTLSGLLATLADAGLGTNTDLYVIGGRSAVADSAKTAYAAASNTDLTSTLTCPETGGTTLTLTLSGRLGSAQAGGTAPATKGASSISAMAPLISKNAVALSTSDISAITDLASLANGVKTRQTFLITLAASPAALSTFKFAGWTEGDAVGAYTPTRSIGASTCSVAADVTKPTVTLRVIPGTRGPNAGSQSAAAHIWLSADEGVSISGMAIDGVNAPIAIGGSGVTGAAVVTGLDGSGNYRKNWLIQLPTESSTAVAASTVVSIAASAVKDAAGNSPAADPIATAAADSKAPTITFGGATVTASAQANYTATQLTVSAKADGAWDGAAGSAFTMSVVNQRGLVAPSIVIDSEAKTIVVTADVNYHTVADIQGAALDAGYTNPVLGDWAVGANVAGGYTTASKLTATLVPATCATLCGTSFVTATINSNEPFFLNTGVAVTVNGLGTPFVTGTAATSPVSYATTTNIATDLKMSRTVYFSTSQLGSAVMSFTGSGNTGVSDTKGNQVVLPISFTVS